MPYPKIRDLEITIPIPCRRHREYGGKKAPTSGCPICEIFYLERRAAMAEVKAALRLLDRYGAIQVISGGFMEVKTPAWMSRGRTRISNTGPRQRQNDGCLLYERLRR